MPDEIHRITPNPLQSPLLKAMAKKAEGSSEKLLIEGHNWDGNTDPWAEFLIPESEA